LALEPPAEERDLDEEFEELRGSLEGVGVDVDVALLPVLLPLPSSRLRRNSSNLVKVRGVTAVRLTKTPLPDAQSKYLTPWTDPSLRPNPTDEPVNFTPTYSASGENCTFPK
jgi:hypothetical protein